MSLEAINMLDIRVTKLEERMDNWDKVLLGIEGTVTLILRDQMALGKKVNELEQEVKGLVQKVDNGFREINDRIDKLERLIVTYCTPKTEFKDIP